MSRDGKVKQFLCTSSKAKKIAEILNNEGYKESHDLEFFYRETNESVEYTGHMTTIEKTEFRNIALGIFYGLRD